MLFYALFTASAIVEFDFIPKESDELSLTRGDYVLNIEMMPGGWWIGTTQSNGKRGLFPENFVRVLDDDSAVVVLRYIDNHNFFFLFIPSLLLK